MSFSEHDDDHELVEFLRQHRSEPPAAYYNIEAQLMGQIGQTEQSQVRSLAWWKLPSAIAAGILVGWGTYYFRAIPRLALNPEELETFIVDNWNHLGEEALTPAVYEDAGWFNTVPSSSTATTTAESVYRQPSTVVVP